MNTPYRAVVVFFLAWLGLSTYAGASEFLRLCQASMAGADALALECKTKARPFKREFLPGGRGPGVMEEYFAWFDTTSVTSHFGFGCVLGPSDRVRFFGIYFALEPQNFRLANSAAFGFID